MDKRTAFLEANPGLAEALELDHPVLRDMKERFERWGDMTPKAVAYALALAKKAAEPPEKHVPAPCGAGRVLVRGKVVSAKTRETAYGTAYKMTVKVETPEGTWLAWGTIPNNLLEAMPCGENGRLYELPGHEVEFTAALKPGRDAHFALFNRPTKARVVA